MIHSVDAMIICQGHTVRSKVARFATVARYLSKVENIGDFEVVYRHKRQSHRLAEDEFMRRWEGGQFVQLPKTEPMASPWRNQEPRRPKPTKAEERRRSDVTKTVPVDQHVHRCPGCRYIVWGTEGLCRICLSRQGTTTATTAQSTTEVR